ncbi:efflux RND transporter periplasmic adaptor subunit [Shewanella gaetbuli]|uniref:HlyD family secretion protein n=1 Tax=Shewanella gaetbuli TaxID=220752 RepID=A0A9X2CMQ1_9GAMM|nr:HlyD family secretion protein [Shewanella gaetbuli]MCL1143900.1 HlyD family secretion protein [Shewanella gaetbuli]
MTPSKRLVIPGVITGLLILILAAALKPAPEQVINFDNAKLVEVIELKQQVVAPKVKGFGRVSPKHVWQAVAEVSGKVIYRHPQLETGRILPAGTLLLQIDPLEYQLTLAQTQANLSSTEAQLVKLEQQEQNLKRSLKLETQKLALVEQEYQRKQSLLTKNLVSSSEVESQKQTLLAQTNVVQDLQSNIKVMADDKNVSLAQKQVNLAQVEDANRRLAQTQVTLPYDSRLSDINIEENQVVTMGETMLVAYQLDTVEVKAEFSLQDMRTLVQSLKDPLALHSASQPNAMPSIENVNLRAAITFQAGDNAFSWPAKVTRVSETVNPNQGTIGVFLEVEQHLNQLNILQRPPLTNGMFISASIEGGSANYFSVPEKALRNQQLYILKPDNTLAIIPVTILFRHDEGVAISGAINVGDKVITNDLIPAIEGMALKIRSTTTDNLAGANK